MELKVIAYARNGHTDKFGIPRQSRDDSPILTRIVFEPEYNVAEALRGIEGYSHLWLLWGFDTDTWSPTVRPPRLGGNKRMGVFATRSPFRPNPIGLSSVRLLKAYPRLSGWSDAPRYSCRSNSQVPGVLHPEGKGERWELLVSGADLMDGTPIYDIKPYLSFSDSHPDARNGFAEETKNYRLRVEWYPSEGVHSQDRFDKGAELVREKCEELSKIREEIEYILSQDPRPAYQDDPDREYKLDYGGWRVTFKVEKAQEGSNRDQVGHGVVKVVNVKKI